MGPESQGHGRHAGNTLEFPPVAEYRFHGSSEQVARNKHSSQVIARVRQRGGVVETGHEHDKVGRFAAKRIM
jgi:hypothetical protein